MDHNAYESALIHHDDHISDAVEQSVGIHPAQVHGNHFSHIKIDQSEVHLGNKVYITKNYYGSQQLNNGYLKEPQSVAARSRSPSEQPSDRKTNISIKQLNEALAPHDWPHQEPVFQKQASFATMRHSWTVLDMPTKHVFGILRRWAETSDVSLLTVQPRAGGERTAADLPVVVVNALRRQPNQAIVLRDFVGINADGGETFNATILLRALVAQLVKAVSKPNPDGDAPIRAEWLQQEHTQHEWIDLLLQLVPQTPAVYLIGRCQSTTLQKHEDTLQMQQRHDLYKAIVERARSIKVKMKALLVVRRGVRQQPEDGDGQGHDFLIAVSSPASKPIGGNAGPALMKALGLGNG